MKHGTEADKLRLPPPTRYNQPHRNKRKFSKSGRRESKKKSLNCAVHFLNNA